MTTAAEPAAPAPAEQPRLKLMRARFEACFDHAVRLAEGPQDTLSVVECHECLCEVDALMEVAGDEAERALWCLRKARSLARDVAAAHALAVLASVPLALAVAAGGALCVGLRVGTQDAYGVLADTVVAIGLYAACIFLVGRWSTARGGALGLLGTWLGSHDRRCSAGNLLALGQWRWLASFKKEAAQESSAAALGQMWDLVEQGSAILDGVWQAVHQQANKYNDPWERRCACAAPWGAAAALVALELAVCHAAGQGLIFASVLGATGASAFVTGAAAVAIAPRGTGVDYPRSASFLEWIFALAGRSPLLLAVGFLMLAGVSPLLEAQLEPLATAAEARLDAAEEAMAATRRMHQALFARMMGALTPASLVERVFTGSTFAEKAENLQELSANAGEHAKLLAMSGARLLPARIRPESARAQARLRVAAVGVGNIVGGVASKVTAVTGLAVPRAPKQQTRANVGNLSTFLREGTGDTEESSESAATSSASTQAQHTPLRQVWSGVKQLGGALLNNTEALEATEPCALLDATAEEQEVQEEGSDAAVALQALDITANMSV